MKSITGQDSKSKENTKVAVIKNYKSELLTFDVHVWWTYIHMCTKYKVYVSNPVPGGGVHR